ncbi:MAG: hypothetical protein JSV65_04100 [Armatimonadota bacterium]|nr:MAG: hypothetical protein JSV65_04100 [Armatimonadota bacterium]
MILPNVWGGGQLFAFSGMEGETGWPGSLVAVTLEDRIGLDFYSGRRPRLWVVLEAKATLCDGTPQAPFGSLKPTVVASDVVVVDVEAVRGSGCRIRMVCTDRAGVLGEVTQQGAGVRVYLALDLSPPGRDTDGGSAGDVVVAAEGAPVHAKWLAPGQRAFELRRPQGRFAVAMETMPSGAADTLQAILSQDMDELCAARMAFFERPPALRGASEKRQRAFAKAFSVLKVNVESPQGAIPARYGVPDRAPHRWMWLWDTAFQSFGYARLDAALARETLLAALSKVRDDGFLPHRMTPDAAGDSDITQPPVLGWAVWSLHQLEPDRDFLERAYEPLSKYLKWDLGNRDRDGDGLLEWAASDESGMDNSPRFDDGVRSAAVDLNAFAAAEAGFLAEIGAALGRPADAEAWRAERQRLATAVEAALWCEEDGMYYDRVPGGGFVRVKTCAGFAPMFAGIASAERVSRLVERLIDPAQFWPAFPVPSVALDEPSFTDDMWRGPTWPSYNYLIVQGLKRYGHDDVAADLAERYLDEVTNWYTREGAFFEFYDCAGRTSPRRLHRKGRQPTHRSGGIPVVTDLNWSAAVFVALAAEKYEA